MKAKIYLIGLPIDKPEFIETFEGDEKDLKDKLLNLQDGYCEDEKPKISEWESDKGTRFIEAVSDSDYNYVAKVIK